LFDLFIKVKKPLVIFSYMRIFICFLLTAIYSIAFSQQYTRQVVQLRNKAFTSGTLAIPSTYLTARAIQRRIRYGIAIDSTDLPVSQRYLDSIRSVPNVQVLSVSRWLNRVLIRTSDASAINRINAFSFVQSTTPQALRTGGNQRTTRNKFTETVTDVDPVIGRTQQPQGVDTVNYGTNYTQVHIHEGEFLHNKNFTGQGMVIAVLDGGFQNFKTITAFDSVRLQGHILGERDFVAYDNSVNEDNVHGMQCLSTICANWPGRMVGTAPAASFWLLRTEDVGSEYPIEEFNWVLGAEFADSVGADLISSSLGYNTFDDPQFNHTYAQLNGNMATVTIGADLAAHKGLMITNSAGNEGNSSWQYLTAPADGDSVVAVGAVNASGAIASFSSKGLPTDTRIKPNVVSIGLGTVIAGAIGPTYGSGTSYANPNLNGLIACLWQAFPERNNQQILNAVYQSADRYAAPDKTYGYGIPNFRRAYRILKKLRNDSIFGTVWLKGAPNPFADTVRVDFIGQVDGTASIALISSSGAIVATKTIPIEEQEIYTVRFDTLINQPPGTYTIWYTDGTNTRTIQFTKLPVTADNWLVVYPVPYRNNFTVAVKSPMAGTATLRLVDAGGKLLAIYTKQVIQNEVYTYQFPAASLLSKGVYFVQYTDGTHKRVKKLVRQ
jgi:serine protease AprX